MVIKFNEVKDNKAFWIYFLATNFPESLDEESDMTLSEILEDKYKECCGWINTFTKFYDDVFEECDGYVDDPNMLTINLTSDIELFISFHPGDTVYFLNDREIGCTGPEYSIKKIAWNEFEDYSSKLSTTEKLLLLPMVYIQDSEKKELEIVVTKGLQDLELEGIDIQLVVEAINANCMID